MKPNRSIYQGATGVLAAAAMAFAGPVAGEEAGARVATLWMVIFNHPEFCATSPCNEPDLGNPDAGPSIVYATGQFSRPNGQLTLVASLYETDPAGFSRVPADTSLIGGPGLTDAEGAEIHLFVRDHGAPIRGIRVEQLTLFDDPGCQSLGGPNLCEDVQFSVHPPRVSSSEPMFYVADFSEVPDARARLIRYDGVVKAVVSTRLAE